jgi:hypothetical protein
MSNATFTPASISFYPQSNLCVVGSNPEMADIDNPRGDIIREVWYIVAANENGDTRESGSFGDHEWSRVDAEKTAVALSIRSQSLGKLPVGFDDWRDGRPQYGSSAYLMYGADDDIEWERQAA